jgi:hypothetical protein
MGAGRRQSAKPLQELPKRRSTVPLAGSNLFQDLDSRVESQSQSGPKSLFESAEITEESPHRPIGLGSGHGGHSGQVANSLHLRYREATFI